MNANEQRDWPSVGVGRALIQLHVAEPFNLVPTNILSGRSLKRTCPLARTTASGSERKNRLKHSRSTTQQGHGRAGKRMDVSCTRVNMSGFGVSMYCAAAMRVAIHAAAGCRHITHRLNSAAIPPQTIPGW